MSIIPHFDLPLRYNMNAQPVVVDQDSLADITNCVAMVLRTRVLQRPEVPSFGISDPVFEVQPIDTQALINSIIENEPRAVVLMDQSPNTVDQLIDNVIVSVASSLEAP